MKRVKWILFVAIFTAYVLDTPVHAQKVERAPKELRKRFHQYPHHQQYAMDKGDFSTMFDIVKKASFAEGKINLIQVACFESYFSSKQCAQLLSLISFDDDKLKALEILVPRLVEMEDMDKIIKNFTFSEGKDKAVKILSKRKR